MLAHIDPVTLHDGAYHALTSVCGGIGLHQHNADLVLPAPHKRAEATTAVCSTASCCAACQAVPLRKQYLQAKGFAY
jgi:hypothetical protein